MRGSILGLALLGGVAGWQLVSTARSAEAPAIAEGPRVIDPAQFLPGPLQARVTADFSNSSLRELVDWLREDQAMSVLVHQRTLEEEGVALADRVTDRLDNGPLYQLLDRLDHLGIGWWWDDGMLHLSTSEDAESRLVTATYNLGDLIDAGYDAYSVVETLLSTVAVDTWAANGGFEGADAMVLGDVLFVSQTDRAQRSVAALLAGLLQHGRQTLVNEPSEHEALREKLNTEVNADFDDMPLAEAVADLAAQSGADIRLDSQALRDLRVREREPVRLTLTDRPLKTVLSAMLRDLDLTCTPRDGVLLVTNDDDESDDLLIAVYDVRDLCRDESETDALIGAIQTQTDVETWAANGGENAEICPARLGTLVVSQREQAHTRLLRLLEMYREALRSSKPRAEESTDEDAIKTVYYRIYRETAADLATRLPVLVPSDSWADPNAAGGLGSIVSVASTPQIGPPAGDAAPQTVPHTTLIITQTNTIHREIAATLQRIQAGDPLDTGEADQSGGGGGLGGGGGGGFGSGYFSVPAESPSGNR